MKFDKQELTKRGQSQNLENQILTEFSTTTPMLAYNLNVELIKEIMPVKIRHHYC